jgi:hypothetical protein
MLEQRGPSQKNKETSLQNAEIEGTFDAVLAK